MFRSLRVTRRSRLSLSSSPARRSTSSVMRWEFPVDSKTGAGRRTISLWQYLFTVLDHTTIYRDLKLSGPLIGTALRSKFPQVNLCEWSNRHSVFLLRRHQSRAQFF